MYHLTVIYGQPDDPKAFDEYYATRHLSLVKKIPGLVRFTAGKCESLDDTPPASYLIAQLTFDSKEACGSALGSSEGQAAAADVANFATGGATMLFSAETTTIP